ncbi:Pentatricopeptide repeat-containing protein [Durusdinium trenchii]|uniref:Chloroplastic n=1 Tax=Durusdinium trenchii TaxID=1381693 RepID=A0ABP0QXT1_9DINO
MPHLYRQWQHHYRADTDRVCLSYDEGNAHNVVDRHVFLTRMQEVTPGLSRWLEYIYTTDIDTKVFFHHMIIPSVAGGQQECPLMTACHAVVQRLLLESLGLVDPPAGTAVALPTLQPPAQLDMAPCFADDGLLAGLSAEVLRALQHWSIVMPRLGLKLSIASDPQVGYYLLRRCCTGGRMKYLARTTPIRHCLPGLVAFDSALRDAFCASTGLALDPQAWKQAQLPVASGGLGLRSAVDFADAAYIGSRLLVLERCHALWTPAAWDGSDGGNELGLAIVMLLLSTVALLDLLHDYCARAQLRPQAEVPGLLDGRRRPADIFLRGGVGLLPALPDGSRPVGLGALALDVAIIHALGPNHWNDTLRGAPDAATAYAQRMREHLPQPPINK